MERQYLLFPSFDRSQGSSGIAFHTNRVVPNLLPGTRQKALPKPSYRKNASSTPSPSEQFKWRRCCVLNPLIECRYSLSRKLEVVQDNGSSGTIPFLDLRE